MTKKEHSCLLISDFTIDNFGGFLSNSKEHPAVKSIAAPFGQVAQVLLDKKLKCWRKDLDSALIWTRPESIIRSFNDLLNYKNVSTKDVLKEVDQYSLLISNACDRARNIFVPAWTLPPHNRGLGVIDMKEGVGITNILMRMNLRLSENLSKFSNIHLLNSHNWIKTVGIKAFNPKLWYMGKIAFSNEVFIKAAADIKSAIRAINGDSKKIIILDLDNTLWGGVIGDTGWEKINLGGHNHVGEAYLDFQHALKSLTNRGILLAIASKNDEKTAVEGINMHSAMVLKLKDFVAWRINWKDKAQNIVDMVSDLNLGLESVVFIDDNPVERARIREALPEVFVPQWPQNPLLYKSALQELNCFDALSISKEDLKKTKMYNLERKRKNLKNKVSSLDEWLKALKIKVEINQLSKSNLQRAAQLLNKTNQMNLSTRRLTESELINWANQKNHKFWVFYVSDKFGNSGLSGIVSLKIEGKQAKIVDFILSCRVIGRKVEHVMLKTAIRYTKNKKLDQLCAEYILTAKNNSCLEFLKESAPLCNDNIFKWKTNEDYKTPEYIKIDLKCK